MLGPNFRNLFTLTVFPQSKNDIMPIVLIHSLLQYIALLPLYCDTYIIAIFLPVNTPSCCSSYKELNSLTVRVK